MRSFIRGFGLPYWTALDSVVFLLVGSNSILLHWHSWLEFLVLLGALVVTHNILSPLLRRFTAPRSQERHS